MANSKSLLLVGITPPPYHGQAIATQLLFEAEEGVLGGARHVRMNFSDSIDEVGRWKFWKLWHLVGVIWKIWGQRFRMRGRTVMYYTPGSSSVASLFRDVCVLLLTRPFFSRTVLHFHSGGVADSVRQSWFGWRWLTSLAFRKASCVMELYPDDKGPDAEFRAGRTEVVVNGIECPEDIDLNKRAEGDSVRFLFVGSMRESKGILVCLRALKAALGTHSNLHLDFVGVWSGDDERKQFESLLAELNLADHVTVHGLKVDDEKWEIFEEVDVFLFPTHYEAENLPLVIIEAMAAGLPVISTKWRGIPSLVKEETGFLVEPRSFEQVGEVMCQLARDRKLRDRLGSQARAKYLQSYSVAAYRERVEKILAEELGVKKRESLSLANGGERDAHVLQVFNRYQEKGGEERIFESITEASDGMEEVRVSNFVRDSREWSGVGGPPFFLKFFRIFYNRTTVKKLREIEESEGIDVILCHNIFPIISPSVYRYALKNKVPLIQYLHNFRPFSVSGWLWQGEEICDAGLRQDWWPEVEAGVWQGSRLKSFAMALVLRNLHRRKWLNGVHKWVACSEFLRDKFIEAGIAPHEIVVIRHGWKPMPEIPAELDRGYYFLVARLVKEKGVDVAIAAWKILEERLGEDCPTLVVGGDGPERNRLEGMAKDSKKIKLMGYVKGKDKADLFTQCRAVIAPSVWWEPLGLVTYEAYDYAKPMLAAAAGGLNETIIDEVTGFFHSPGDAEELANTVIRVQEMTPEARRAMGLEGRKWLEAEANYDDWRQKLESLVKKSIL